MHDSSENVVVCSYVKLALLVAIALPVTTSHLPYPCHSLISTYSVETMTPRPPYAIIANPPHSACPARPGSQHN
jgi:hypothetical protein